MTPADLERLARMCEHGRNPDPRLGRDLLVALAGWRVDGRELLNDEGHVMCLADEPRPHPENNPTGSLDACRQLSRWPLVAACDGVTRCTVELAGGYVGNAASLARAYAAAICRARAATLAAAMENPFDE